MKRLIFALCLFAAAVAPTLGHGADRPPITEQEWVLFEVLEAEHLAADMAEWAAWDEENAEDFTDSGLGCTDDCLESITNPIKED